MELECDIDRLMVEPYHVTIGTKFSWSGQKKGGYYAVSLDQAVEFIKPSREPPSGQGYMSCDCLE
ncbi:hypothetical protein BME99_28675 [Pseudomonas protegens]|nr:hypothetical protein BME99_28675 [Pseudomonas protegens]